MADVGGGATVCTCLDECLLQLAATLVLKATIKHLQFRYDRAHERFVDWAMAYVNLAD